MQKPLAIIIMGSSSDMAHAELITKHLNDFGIQSEKRISSAHKTPMHLLDILKNYESTEQKKIYITVAGRSNALSGFVDGFVKSPTIACPPVSDSFAGADIYSSLRMPSGIAPALVLEPQNAALLAAKIFSLFDLDIKKRLALYVESNMAKIIQDDANCNAAN